MVEVNAMYSNIFIPRVRSSSKILMNINKHRSSNRLNSESRSNSI